MGWPQPHSLHLRFRPIPQFIDFLDARVVGQVKVDLRLPGVRARQFRSCLPRRLVCLPLEGPLLLCAGLLWWGLLAPWLRELVFPLRCRSFLW